VIDIDALEIGQKVWHFTYGELSIQEWSETKQTIIGLSPTGQVRYFSPANCELLAAHQAREERERRQQLSQEDQERQRQQEQEDRLLAKQRRAQARKAERENANVVAYHDDLLKRGYPEFTRHEEYESLVFVLTDDNRPAYTLLWEYAMAHLAELAADESAAAVIGTPGFDVWADATTTDEAVAWLTSLGVPDATRYVNLASPKSHGVKVNLCLPNAPELANLDHLLQTNTLHARRLVTGQADLRTIQIGKRSLCGQIIRDGILPKEVQ
jgi:hypothetical protein